MAPRCFALVVGIVLSLSPQALVGQSRVYPTARSGGNYMHNYYFPPAPSSTPWAPAWAPDGKSIAAAMNGSIWQIDPASGEAEELTADDKYHSLPAWSPDGRYLAYVADDGGTNIHLYMLEVATGKTWPLGNDQFVYTDPAFSPDGTTLAYVSTKPNGYFNVYVRPVRDGQWSGEEVAVTSDHSFGRDRLYFGEWDVNITPVWLKDSRELLIVSNRDVALPVWVSIANQPVRSRAAAEYCLKWIDLLQKQADAWPDWRSQKEKDHVFAQFDEARAVYRRFLSEASAGTLR